MDGFKYVDIFATKGIEYIFIICFLAILVFFWKWLNKPSDKVKAAIHTMKEKSVSLIDWFLLKEDYYFHQGHSWAFPEDKNIVKVGIDDFAQKLLGKPTAVLLPKIGDKIEQGEKGFAMQFDKKNIDLLSPVEGEVIEINQDVINSPDLLNKEPYKNGWLMKVKVPKMRSNFNNLLTGKLAKAWLEDTVEKISNTMTKDVGIVMQDGGVPISGFVKEIAKDNWENIAKEFLLTDEVSQN